MRHHDIGNRQHIRRGSAAFGLLGLLVVVSIMLYLFFGNMGGTSYTQQLSNTRKKGITLSIDIEAHQLATTITSYQITNNKLPETIADLDAGLFLDPWKNPLSFTIEKQGRSTVAIITSNGPDGEPDTEDDLTATEPLPF